MAKTVHLAGKLHTGEGTLKDFSDELEVRGHTVLEKWFEQGRATDTISRQSGH